MLSKLIIGEDADTLPVVWRSRIPLRAAAFERVAGKPEPLPEAPGPTAEETNAAIQQRLLQAHESGFREGEAAGRKNAEAQVQKAVEGLAAAVAETAAARGDAIRRAEADTVRLAIEIARRILHREISLDPSALESLVRTALDKLSGQEVCRVRVHPDQEQMLRSCLQRIARNPEVEVVSDPSQSRGGAVFETSRGALDASVETQLREIERGLADHLGDRP
jgi:flagellar assembly protein FliH